jgi:hypothetical protein
MKMGFQHPLPSSSNAIGAAIANFLSVPGNEKNFFAPKTKREIVL